MLDNAATILFLACAFVSIVCFLMFLGSPDPFEYEQPARRYCKKCGQRQEQHCWSWDWSMSGSWWEDMGEIKDKDCKCHRYVTYRSLI